jgi:cellulose synthase (UDP-forming)
MNSISSAKANRLFLLLNVVLAIAYFICIAFFFPIGNPVLFGLLIGCEVFHLLQALGYVHTVWPRKHSKEFETSFSEPVAVYITVTGEPADIVEATVRGALSMEYPAFNVYILNDGYVANRENWQEAEEVALKYGITCITRTTPGGAKAGNINNALSKTTEPFVVVFDADHIPKSHFLWSLMGYFVDKRVGFVQSPQFYKNQDQNLVTAGSWEQQELFFGAILKGKDAINSAFMCGTNMAVRRKALEQVGGMSEFSIAEDFLTSLLIHQKKWKSVYVDAVLAEGLAPEDFLSYYKQQFRWARGSLEVVFKYNPLFRKGLTTNQRIQYLSSASFYLSGVVVLINALLPLVYFYSGLQPLTISTMTLALFFLPYIFIVLYTVQLTSGFSYTFRALSFSISSFPIHLQAIWQIITRKKSGFVVTSKRAIKGNHSYLVTPHIVYIVLVILGVIVGSLREGLNASILSNAAWSLVYVFTFIPFIMAAFQKFTPDSNEEIALKPVTKEVIND